MKKVKQQKVILVVAMYILRQNGYVQPHKHHVLGFMKNQKLMRIPDEEIQRRGNEEIWQNDIAWKRKDLFEDGYIRSPARGYWELTEKAEEYVRKMKAVWIDLESLNERTHLLSLAEYFSDELLDWKLRIARNEDLILDTNRAPVEGPSAQG